MGTIKRTTYPNLAPKSQPLNEFILIKNLQLIFLVTYKSNKYENIFVCFQNLLF